MSIESSDSVADPLNIGGDGVSEVGGDGPLEVTESKQEYVPGSGETTSEHFPGEVGDDQEEEAHVEDAEQRVGGAGGGGGGGGRLI